ncbi:RNA polymerase sigma factor [Novipirellula artificiosorum]|uniref:RNA polymerase sigma factor RpoE n=1 Tax=Novipirellula artificiosorum TaxID=2528016 RepID=A0A5C6D7V3_9BACT|nr:sigma-70 family RNA polymerase sigma factor [Novipirellula artificiosorum]TWU32900.1 RNA polymerase sigma factor RpoE [Novipirellula artificiosorum]
MNLPNKTPNQPKTRQSLILQLKKQRDQDAWHEFVSVYESFLMRLVERRGVPKSHVPDVTNQVLAAIARSIDSWQDDDHDASFRRWINRVARNVVIKYMSRERRQIAAAGGTDAFEALAQCADQPDPALARQYEHELIVWAAEQVKAEFVETSWTAFWETMIEGRSVAEVAETLSVSAGSIYMSRGRIMKRIREKVSEVMDR